MVKKRKKKKRPEISVRTPDPALKERLERVAKEISRPMAQIVRDGVTRELNELETNHPFYTNRDGHNHSQAGSVQELAIA